MPRFDVTPPDETKKFTLELRRAQPGPGVKGICTCDNLIGCHTHYYGGRTVPCEGEECEACKDGFTPRWHGYISAFSPISNEHFLFEMTQTAAEKFNAFQNEYSTLRGCLFIAKRRTKSPNSRLLVQLKPSNPNRKDIPDAPRIERILCHIWNVPFDEMSTHETIKHIKETLAAKRKSVNGSATNKPPTATPGLESSR